MYVFEKEEGYIPKEKNASIPKIAYEMEKDGINDTKSVFCSFFETSKKNDIHNDMKEKIV